MYENPYDRKFGIEFEFNIPNFIKSSEKCDALHRTLEKSGLKGFRVGRDGSEFEVKTPPLSGPNGFKTVKKFLGVVNKMGARTNSMDGLHVHHDAPEFVGNKSNVVKLVSNWLENQEEIMKMVSSNRYGRGACPLWTEEALSNLHEQYGQNHAYFGRRNLNVGSLHRYGTIEIRAHEGTLDYESVFSWVRFGQAFIGKVIMEPGFQIEKVDNPVQLLQRLNISRNASRFITRKMRENYGRVITA